MKLRLKYIAALILALSLVTMLVPGVFAEAQTRFVILENNAGSYSTNVRDGESTSEPVTFSSLSLTITIAKDGGAEQRYTNGTRIRNKGSYVARMYLSGAVAGEDEPADIVRFTLTSTTISDEDVLLIEAQSPVDPSAQVNTNLGEYSGASAQISYTNPDGASVSLADASEMENIGSDIGGGAETTSASSPSIWDYAGAVGNSASADDEAVPAVAQQQTYEYTLQGTYHAEFGLYEFEFAGKYFYTNIDNGAITTTAAQLDFPADITYSLKKDGNDTAYQNQASITEPGSYVFTLETDSYGNQYYAVFRFRLQQGVSDTTTAPPATSAGSQETAPPETEASEAETSETETESPTLEDYENMSDEELLDALEQGPTAEDEDYAESLQDIGVSDGVTLAGAGSYTGINEEYVPEKGMYLQTLVGGSAFYSSIPNGAYTNSGVRLELGANMPGMTLYRDNAEIDYVPGETISGAGVYTIIFETTLEMKISAAPQPKFSFRIITSAVNDLTVFNTPWGYELRSVELDDVVVEDFGRYSYRLGETGSYEFTYAPSDGSAPELRFTAVQDSIPPIFTVEGSGSSAASVSFLSDDIGIVELYKDNKQISFQPELTGAGAYTIIVYDEAGNFAAQSFEVVYVMNAMSVLSIVVVVAIVVAGVVLLLRGSGRLKVR